MKITRKLMPVKKDEEEKEKKQPSPAALDRDIRVKMKKRKMMTTGNQQRNMIHKVSSSPIHHMHAPAVTEKENELIWLTLVSCSNRDRDESNSKERAGSAIATVMVS